MNPERCRRTGCTKQAAFVPAVRFWALGTKPADRSIDNAGTVAVSLSTCEDCRDTVQLCDVMTEKFQREIEGALARVKKQPPDWGTAQLVWMARREFHDLKGNLS